MSLAPAKLRVATLEDLGPIQEVYASAFPAEEREAVSRCAVQLLSESSTPPTLSLVAEVEDVVVGHIAFSPVGLSDGSSGYILAPLAVSATFQQQGIGRALVESGLRELTERGACVVCVYGDPEHYGRYGFDPETARAYPAPHPLQYPHGWQALELQERAVPPSPVAVTCVAALDKPELW